MTDRPIIFSGPMVKALLAGRKTQTRRLISTKPSNRRPNLFDGSWGDGYVLDPGNASWREAAYPWRVADRLWVRENWKPHSSFAGMKPRDVPKSRVFYMADCAYAPSNTPWVPCIHMPRWASRLTLTVTDVRVQRLQEISEDDAVAEGVQTNAPGFPEHGIYRCLMPDGKWHFGDSAYDLFAKLWNSIHGPDAWAANPWVVAISFITALHNIDAAPAERTTP